MSEKEYIVLYTHQKTKKAKTWQDGHLKVSKGTRAILYDEKKAKLDVIHIRPEVIIPGEQLESDRFLILVEEEKTSQGSTSSETQSPLNNVIQQQTVQHGLRASVAVPGNPRAMTTGTRTGIKRKKMGFVPPRMVKPRIEVSCDRAATDGAPDQYRNPTNLNNAHSESVARTNVSNLYSESDSKQGSPQHQVIAARFGHKNIIYPQSSNESSGRPEEEYSPVERSNMLSHFISKLRKSSPVVGDNGNQNSSQEQRSLPPSPWSSYGTSSLQKTNVNGEDSLPMSPVLSVSQTSDICGKSIDSRINYSQTCSSEGQLTTASKSAHENSVSPSATTKSGCGNKRSALQILALLKSKESASKVLPHSAVSCQSDNKPMTCSDDGYLSITSCKTSWKGTMGENKGPLPHDRQQTDKDVDKMLEISKDSSKIKGFENASKCADDSNTWAVDAANLENKLQNIQHISSHVKSENSSINIKDRKYTGSSCSDNTDICNSNISEIVDVNKSFQSVSSIELDMEAYHKNNEMQNNRDNYAGSDWMNDVNAVVNPDCSIGETDNMEDSYCGAQEATFHISYSPLAHVTDSEEEEDKKSCHNEEEVYHEKTQGPLTHIDERLSYGRGNENGNHNQEYCLHVDEKASCDTGSEDVNHKDQEHCSHVDEKASCGTGNENVNHKDQEHCSHVDEKASCGTGNENVNHNYQEHCSHIDEKSSEDIEKEQIREHCLQFGDKSFSALGNNSVVNCNVQTYVMPALCDTGISPTESHQLASDRASGETESITHKTVPAEHLLQYSAQSNSLRNTCQSPDKQECKQENVNIVTGVGALSQENSECVVNEENVTNCIGMHKATGNKVAGSNNKDDYLACMSNETKEKEISSTHSFVTYDEFKTRRQQNSLTMNTENCSDNDAFSASDSNNCIKHLSNLDWSQESPKCLNDLEFSEDSLRMVSLSSDRENKSTSFKLASMEISENKTTIEIDDETRTAASIPHGSESLCEDVTYLDQEMIPSSLPSVGESDVALNQFGDYLQNCTHQTKGTKQDVLSHTECQTLSTDTSSQGTNYWKCSLENQHSYVDREKQREYNNCAIQDFKVALKNFTNSDIINRSETNAIEEFKMAVSELESVSERCHNLDVLNDRKQTPSSLKYNVSEVKDHTTRNLDICKMHEDLRMKDTHSIAGKLKSIGSDDPSNLGDLHFIPQPSELQSLLKPSELQSLPHRSKLQSLPHPSELQSLPHPSELQSLPKPSEPQSLPHPSELQSLPKPSELQSLPNGQNKYTYLSHSPNLQCLPYPTDLLKPSLVSQQHMDVVECANKKLQQYKMKGSVCGGRATRKPSTGIFTRSELLKKLSSDATGARTSRLLHCTASDNNGIQVTRTTNISHVDKPTTTHQETSQNFSPYTRSPSQKLEEMSSPSSLDESSMFVGWNDGRPTFVKKYMMAVSPYQFVPRTKQPEQTDSEDNQQVPDTDVLSCLLTRPFLPDASSPEYGSMFAARKSHSTVMKTNVEDQQSDHLSPELLRNSSTCKERKISVLETPRCLSKEKKALKSKPFDDPFTHTKYGKCYFSPLAQTTPVVDMDDRNKANDRKGFLPCSSQISQVPVDYDKRQFCFEKVLNKEDINKENVLLNPKSFKCNASKNSHLNDDMNVESWSNPSNNSNGVSPQNSTEQNKLQLGNSNPSNNSNGVSPQNSAEQNKLLQSNSNPSNNSNGVSPQNSAEQNKLLQSNSNPSNNSNGVSPRNSTELNKLQLGNSNPSNNSNGVSPQNSAEQNKLLQSNSNPSNNSNGVSPQNSTEQNKHLQSNSNPSNNSNGVSPQNSTEQNKLQLSNSSIDSSDLELSFLGVDVESVQQSLKQCCQDLSKPDSSLIFTTKDVENSFCVGRDKCEMSARENSLADGQEGISFPLSDHAQNSRLFEAEEDLSDKKVKEFQNKLEQSKWGKYVFGGDDTEDEFDTSSDKSFEDRYHLENSCANIPGKHWEMVQPVLCDSSAQKSIVSTPRIQAIVHKPALKTPAMLTQTPDQQSFHNWPNRSICRMYSSNSEQNQEEQESFTANVQHNLDTEISADSSATHGRLSSSPAVIHSRLGHHSLGTPRCQINTPVLRPAVLHQKTQFSQRFQSPVPRDLYSAHVLKSSQRNLGGDLQFASKEEVENNPSPVRDIQIPTTFSSASLYRQVFTAALKEYLNIVLFEQAKQYHHALSKVDISAMVVDQNTAPAVKKQKTSTLANKNPPCQCGAPSKMVPVKKSGPNQGRLFYACNAARNQQCKWADQDGDRRVRGKTSQQSKLKLCDTMSVNTYMRSRGIVYYHGCEFLKKSQEDIEHYFKKNVPEWIKRKYRANTNPDQKKLYVHLSKKDSSSQFTKDDLWIISQSVEFHPSRTFLARSTYYGPNSSNDLEIEPITAFSPSNWSNHVSCHCIQAGNVSSELTYLSNLQENLTLTALPILPSLLSRYREPAESSRFKAPLKNSSDLPSTIHAPDSYVRELAEQLIEEYNLNADQSLALRRLCDMFCEEFPDPVLLIHGVFGAGKSFLLSVMVIFLVKLFEMNNTYIPGVPYEWKILISSTTNVAVDRILNGLLRIGFEDFVRVGSVKKISKPILPYSFHATGTDSQELKDLQEMLRSGDLSPSEKHNVKQSIEKHRLGENKKKLGQVRVVGVTCASCSANSINNMLFPVVITSTLSIYQQQGTKLLIVAVTSARVVLLDECSQMMEPASLLPIAKFSCRKLVLVGDPKQLDPTIPGAEAAHDKGLEQTLFDRLIKMGHEPTMLRTQYRCHPDISRLSNTLFYNGQLQDGVSVSDRSPLSEDFSTLCFYDVNGAQEQVDMGHSYYNEKEVDFVVFLIEYLISHGVEPADIGVITLYKSQMFRINTKLNMTKSDSHKEMKSLRVSTVDAFQGGEHDIIILSCVRTDGVGFIDNAKRTNVALSRAKHHLLIVGNKKNLSKDGMWANILQQCTRKPGGIQDYKAAKAILESKSRELSTQIQCDGSHGKIEKHNTQTSELSSPPMSLSDSCEETLMEKDAEQETTGQESTKSTRRRMSRQINADLLDSGSSDDDLPAYDL